MAGTGAMRAVPVVVDKNVNSLLALLKVPLLKVSVPVILALVFKLSPAKSFKPILKKVLMLPFVVVIWCDCAVLPLQLKKSTEPKIISEIYDLQNITAFNKCRSLCTYIQLLLKKHFQK